MTKKERDSIKEAMRLFGTDDGYERGMNVLKKLLNPDYKSIFTELDRPEFQVPINKLDPSKESEFYVSDSLRRRVGMSCNQPIQEPLTAVQGVEEEE